MVWEQAVVTFIIGCIFALFYASFNLSEDHAILKFLLFSFGFGLMGIGLGIVTYLIKLNIPNPDYYAYPLTALIIILIIIYLYYFFIKFLVSLIMELQKMAKNKKDKKVKHGLSV